MGSASAVAAVEAPPANDNFAQAQTLGADEGFLSGSNVDATKEVGEPNHAGVPGGTSIWFRWNSARAGRTVVSACADFDAVLAVYTGAAVGALTPVTSTLEPCVDGVSFATTPGTDYWIALDGVSGLSGTFSLDWFQRPANDDRTAATLLAGDAGQVAAANRHGSLEPDEPEPAGPGGASVWYRWTAPSPGPARFDTCTGNGGFDTLLAVYEGASTTPLAANDDFNGCAEGSTVGWTAEAGKEYLIALDGFDGDWVAVQLEWSRAATPPANLVRPVIFGTAQELETLSANPGNWSGTAPMSFSYQWGRCNQAATFCQLVPGSNSLSYILGPDDVASRMRFFITATNAAGSETVNSAATAPVTGRPASAPRNTVAPTVTGTAAERETLTATAGMWDGYPPPTFDFQWQSCDGSGNGCRLIPGVTSSSLVLSLAEAGRRVRAVVFARNTVGTVTAVSNLTAQVRAVSAVRTVRRRCVVPDVRGKRLAVARKAIVTARCRLGRVTHSFSTRIGKGKVIRQRPAPRTRRPVGTKIQLVVSRGRRR
jgi:hypothetical protein